jgi:hypothetical protein
MGLPEKIETRLFIDGEVRAVPCNMVHIHADTAQFCESSNGKTFPIKNPSTLELVANGV